jgi:hypothetical protein
MDRNEDKGIEPDATATAAKGSVHLQGCGCTSCAAGGAAPAPVAHSYIYAIGRIDTRFPSLGVEREFAQVMARDGTVGKTDRQTFHAVLTKRENRYLARMLCWVFSVEGLETYLLMPRDPGNLDQLIEALRPVPRITDVNVAIGVRGPLAPSDMCNGLQVPVVGFDQIYSFDVDSLTRSIPCPEKIPAEEFAPAAEELFHRIMQLADNAGATDDHRAINYLAVRYPAIYALTAEAFGRNASLSSVEVRPSRLSGPRKVVDVVFEFTHRNTDVRDRYFTRVDVTEEFPFLVTKMSPYYDR